jgi:hypothetical protein
LDKIAENMQFQELNGDQSRELINSSQRFEAYLDAQQRERGYRGSVSNRWPRLA